MLNFCYRRHFVIFFLNCEMTKVASHGGSMSRQEATAQIMIKP